MLFLTNTKIGIKEQFNPIDGKNVRMYVCGPTVYDFAHIGNARSAVNFDILYRTLKTIYENVTYVRNVTDIDDKIINECVKKNVSAKELTNEMIANYQQDIKYLNVLPPTIEPKATDHLNEMISMIETLIKKGFAYESEGQVLFSVDAYKNYGCISSKKSLDDLNAGSRIYVESYKKSPNDFILWKPEKNLKFGFDSPFGYGRPGWHIECSAMSMKYLGTPFDIHGGGIDLLFPHHENENAQSCCYSDSLNMANFWVHNGHLSVDSQKMSKSLGNFITVRELSKNYSSAVLRLALISTHYRKPLNWSDDLLEMSRQTIMRWSQIPKSDHLQTKNPEILEILYDDLNTPRAIALIHDLANSYFKKKSEETAFKFHDCLSLLGISFEEETVGEKILDLIEKRSIAKKNKDFKAADLIREKLLGLGISLKDTKDGTTWKKNT